MTGPVKRALAWGLRRSGLFRLHAERVERERAILLVYHRVNDEGDPFFPALSRRAFEDQLDHVASHYRVEPLEEVVAWLADGAPGRPRAAVTIDDGHPDTAEVAYPALERRGLPATLFLATLPPETGGPLWIDRARWMVKHARAREIAAPALGLPRWPLDGRAARLGLLARLLGRLKAMGPPELDGVLAHLAASLEPEGPPLRVLGWDAVRRMAAGGVRLGGHTHRHYMLSRLDDHALEEEIAAGHRLIEERTGHRVRSFAYPNGEAADYDDRAVAALRRLGVGCAVTCRDGFARPGQDTLRLPRLYTSVASLSLFAARLAGLGREEAPAVELS
ncbi:MAG TPA: polysaccharide deacetylase family protein [Vicinamibacteria bacterium]|nr:polysaccharide deacetylase family protein [Vicinamibacteria bacterium]